MQNNRHGFSLVESLIAIGVFLLFAAGVYSSIQFVFRLVYQSRIRIVEAALLNEQIEIIRNMPFESIGTIGGIPSGALSRTVTSTQNGVVFTTTLTVRNIDDPFDGTINGNPPDLAPTDYKFVALEIICASCRQQTPYSLSTIIAPKYLEGGSDTGALFIEVFDANAQPVSGATVHIVATSTNPAVDVTDTTDQEGKLHVVGVPAGQHAYLVSVYKAGYTQDATIVPTVSNPNPQTPPVSIVAQSITEVSLEIDRISSLAITTLTSTCDPVGAASIDTIGNRLIGTSPDVHLINTTVISDAEGTFTSSSFPWDTVTLSPTAYDLIGAIPGMPIVVPPNTAIPVQLLLGDNTAHSLLVHVRDSVSLQPLSQASVTLAKTGYSENTITGVGHIRQTGWSGGDGQSVFTNATKYWADDGYIEGGSPAGDIKLKEIAGAFVIDGSLESSTFDFGVAANPINIMWEPFSQPAEAGSAAVRFQIATSDMASPETWEFLGPDGTASTYYASDSIDISHVHDGDRYVRYKVFLHSDSELVTPTVSDVAISYTTSCTPPGQAYFGGLTESEYALTVSLPGYQTVIEEIPVDGDGNVVINMVQE